MHSPMFSYVKYSGSVLLINSFLEVEMIFYDSEGAPMKILQHPPDKPNTGLDFNFAPNGNELNEFNARFEKVDHMCNTTTGMHMSQREEYTTLVERLPPYTRFPQHEGSYLYFDQNLSVFVRALVRVLIMDSSTDTKSMSKR